MNKGVVIATFAFCWLLSASGEEVSWAGQERINLEGTLEGLNDEKTYTFEVLNSLLQNKAVIVTTSTEDVGASSAVVKQKVLQVNVRNTRGTPILWSHARNQTHKVSRTICSGVAAAEEGNTTHYGINLAVVAKQVKVKYQVLVELVDIQLDLTSSDTFVVKEGRPVVRWAPDPFKDGVTVRVLAESYDATSQVCATMSIQPLGCPISYLVRMIDN